MPDRAIRNWLERSAENLFAGQRTSPFPAGSGARMTTAVVAEVRVEALGR